MTGTQATDVVTFDFKGTGVRCVVFGTFDYQIHVESTDINIKRTELYCLNKYYVSLVHLLPLEPRHYKTCLQGLREDPTQTWLYSHR